MAQSGYTPILIYASGTGGNTPAAGNLTSNASGAELALNYADGKLFYKDSGGVVQLLASKAAAAVTSGTSGGIPYYSSATAISSSAALAANALVIGGGAGAAPSTITTGTGVVTALGVNTGSAGAFVVNGGALGTPSSGTVTNLTGTASININGTVGGTTPAAGTFTTATANSFIPNSSTVPTNGMYLPASNTLGWAVNSNKKLDMTSTALTTTSMGLYLYGVNSGSIRTLYCEAGLADPFLYANYGNTAYVSGESATNAAIYVRKDNGTSRSINAAGTINASGADYAEYERKAALDKDFAKGEVVGFNADGKLVPSSQGVTFGVKSTNPSYVGGDAWADAESIGEAPLNPRAKREDESDEDYAVVLQEFEQSRAAHAEKVESARQWVDRIAYSGKVPVNVKGAQSGNLIVADNGGEAWDLTADPSVPDWFKKYLRSVGRVRRILPDGRAEIAVYVL